VIVEQTGVPPIFGVEVIIDLILLFKIVIIELLPA